MISSSSLILHAASLGAADCWSCSFWFFFQRQKHQFRTNTTVSWMKGRVVSKEYVLRLHVRRNTDIRVLISCFTGVSRDDEKGINPLLAGKLPVWELASFVETCALFCHDVFPHLHGLVSKQSCRNLIVKNTKWHLGIECSATSEKIASS